MNFSDFVGQLLGQFDMGWKSMHGRWAFRRGGFWMGGAGEGFGDGMIDAGMFMISHALGVGYGRLSANVRGI